MTMWCLCFLTFAYPYYLNFYDMLMFVVIKCYFKNCIKAKLLNSPSKAFSCYPPAYISPTCSSIHVQAQTVCSVPLTFAHFLNLNCRHQARCPHRAQAGFWVSVAALPVSTVPDLFSPLLSHSVQLWLVDEAVRAAGCISPASRAFKGTSGSKLGPCSEILGHPVCLHFLPL